MCRLLSPASIRRKRGMKSLSVIEDIWETEVISRGLFSAPISDQGSGLFAKLEPKALLRPLKILRSPPFHLNLSSHRDRQASLLNATADQKNANLPPNTERPEDYLRALLRCGTYHRICSVLRSLFAPSSRLIPTFFVDIALNRTPVHLIIVRLTDSAEFFNMGASPRELAALLDILFCFHVT